MLLTEILVKGAVAAAEVTGVSAMLHQRFGRPVLKRNLMIANGVLIFFALSLKAWQITRPMVWFFIDFMLFLLLSMFYQGDMKKQACMVLILSVFCVLLELAAAWFFYPVGIFSDVG